LDGYILDERMDIFWMNIFWMDIFWKGWIFFGREVNIFWMKGWISFGWKDEYLLDERVNVFCIMISFGWKNEYLLDERMNIFWMDIFWMKGWIYFGWEVNIFWMKGWISFGWISFGWKDGYILKNFAEDFSPDETRMRVRESWQSHYVGQLFFNAFPTLSCIV
jgi:hypothetical protein